MGANYNPTDICYLCGNELDALEVNEDHIFQQQFLEREQPKARGFDYGGFLFVHKNCNSSFGGAGQGPESICRKALSLMEVLHSDHSQWKVRKDDPEIKIVAINSASLSDFTKVDLEFFKLIDARNVPYDEWASGKHFEDKQKVNPIHIPTNVALSTLMKSAAGFLVRRFDFPRNKKWRILAIPHMGQDAHFDLDHIFGDTKPLEVGIKLWIKNESTGMFGAYKHNRMLVFFAFESKESNLFPKVKRVFKDASCLFFGSDKLIDLVGYDWCSNEYPL